MRKQFFKDFDQQEKMRFAKKVVALIYCAESYYF